MSSYEPAKIEQKWQKSWQKAKAFTVDLANAKDPYYSMVMFPYPSGDKLHVGHWYNFAPADSYSRYMRLRGKDVFCPMGFDAFGLPAENYAIKTGVHPDESITTNVETMITQLQRIGCMYDWEKTLNTSKPDYYRWTQWLFLQMFQNDLAYQKQANVNWCPSCHTVLANEQAQDGTCERCGSKIVQKPMKQWYWKITDYAQRLLDGLENLDWPKKTKSMQQNWIGRTEGITFTEKIKDSDIEIQVYDTVPQTYIAQTFVVIAPEHALVPELVAGTEYEKDVLDFVEKIQKKKAAGRFDIEKDMEGIFSGRYIENPFGTGDLPLWLASYVVADYGTGIVNCSAHDERDFAFAKKYDIPLKIAMVPADAAEAEKVRNFAYCYARDPKGIMEAPAAIQGLNWAEARTPVIEHIEKENLGERSINYRLRDWTISRQRYWGAPIPIVYDPEGKPHSIPEEHLPWELPRDVEFKPTGTSPLAQSKELVERTEKIFGKGWTPEVDTMDTFVCSSFYQFRYLAEGNAKEFIPKEIDAKWMPVDLYIGGPEHACMHLIYARFVTKALKDFGYISHDEPFQKLVHQGLITKDSAKMSKSKGNVVSPDAFIDEYGSDVFRMYLMFMGPFTLGGDWSDTGIKGIDRFVQRIWKICGSGQYIKADSQEITAKLHATIKKVTADIERLQFNTCLSALMELLNMAEKEPGISAELAKTFAILLAPFAPHLAEELWEVYNSGLVIDQTWPTYDEKLLETDTVTIVVQIQGKVRAELQMPADISAEDAIALAKNHENVQKYLENTTIRKEIYVPQKLVSLVIG